MSRSPWRIVDQREDVTVIAPQKLLADASRLSACSSFSAFVSAPVAAKVAAICSSSSCRSVTITKVQFPPSAVAPCGRTSPSRSSYRSPGYARTRRAGPRFSSSLSHGLDGAIDAENLMVLGGDLRANRRVVVKDQEIFDQVEKAGRLAGRPQERLQTDAFGAVLSSSRFHGANTSNGAWEGPISASSPLDGTTKPLASNRRGMVSL